ncbi:SRPBCC family protein [Lolliginicoccus suaedae]|uniref:SRPBCC family protein n=1 Tax=Lolliginicoccus suaedae TaxID=2605429 RepID=UPI0011EDFCA5|nr:SRPBCC family protein [Lolliginicoccus suaedae]
MTDDTHVVQASRIINAPAARIFELIADPAQQPSWDGNDNLAEAPAGQRVRSVGEVFTMTTKKGNTRENHVVEFTEGRLIAWTPADVGKPPFGHLWRWEVEPLGHNESRVTHTYDWSRLTDESRFPRARATGSANLAASIDRLAGIAETQ